LTGDRDGQSRDSRNSQIMYSLRIGRPDESQAADGGPIGRPEVEKFA
jgi:hypothetical protein